MDTGRFDWSVLAWVVAGIPLLITFGQTVFSLLDWTSASIGGVLDPVLSVDVFYEAAVVFKAQPALVASLFVLIATAWVVQGIAMLSFEHRDLAFGAAGLASVLYAALFFGVYSPLFEADIATGQLIAFFVIPILATGLIGGSAWTHDWSEKVRKRAAGDLGAIESELDDARSTFESQFERSFGDLEAVEPIAPTGVETARNSREEFHARCDELEARLDELRVASTATSTNTDIDTGTGPGTEPKRSTEPGDDGTKKRSAVDAQSLDAAVSDVDERVAGLDPDDAIERIDSNLRGRLRSGIRTTLESVRIWSADGEEYRLGNLETTYREVELGSSGDVVRTNEVGTVLLERLEGGEAIADLGASLESARAHVERVKEHVADREADIVEEIDRLESQFTTVESELERVPDGMDDCAREVLVENRHEDVTGVRALERDIGDARAALHQCQFAESERRLEEANERAQTLVTTAEFLRSLEGRLNHGVESVSIPPEVDVAAIEAMAQALEEAYDIKVTVESDRISFEWDGSGDETEPTTAGRTPTSGAAVASPGTGGDVDGDADATGTGQRDVDAGTDTGPVTAVDARPGEVLDAVLFVFRELENAAASSDDGVIQFQTGELPSTVGRPAVLSTVERYLSHQSDLVKSVSLQSPDPPSFLEVTVADEIRASVAIQTARERFAEQYG